MSEHQHISLFTTHPTSRPSHIYYTSCIKWDIDVRASGDSNKFHLQDALQQPSCPTVCVVGYSTESDNLLRLHHQN